MVNVILCFPVTYAVLLQNDVAMAFASGAEVSAKGALLQLLLQLLVLEVCCHLLHNKELSWASEKR